MVPISRFHPRRNDFITPPFAEQKIGRRRPWPAATDLASAENAPSSHCWGMSPRSRFAPYNQIGQFVKPLSALAERLQHLVGALALRFRHAAGGLQAVDRRKSNLVLLRVLAGGLAERLGRLFDVQDIVHNLEGQADVLAITGKRGILRFRRARIDGAEPQAGTEQGAGFGAMDGLE